jgi:hypothetical protein
MKRLRRVLELFNGCLGACDDMNEPRFGYAMVDMLGMFMVNAEYSSCAAAN